MSPWVCSSMSVAYSVSGGEVNVWAAGGAGRSRKTGPCGRSLDVSLSCWAQAESGRPRGCRKRTKGVWRGRLAYEQKLGGAKEGARVPGGNMAVIVHRIIPVSLRLSRRWPQVSIRVRHFRFCFRQQYASAHRPGVISPGAAPHLVVLHRLS